MSNRIKDIPDTHYINGWMDTPAGRIPTISTRLQWVDIFGTLLARLTINRMHYMVDPGIYAVGNPTSGSIVLVSANYKMSFDFLRRELKGIDAWILVLDTKGINVWCAAGKGTFGTQEVVNRIMITNLKKIVNHRKLILPQLGATGVAAHEVKELSGFSVVYAPVRASELPVFLNNSMKATPEMRQVRFSWYDRLVLLPAEMTERKYYVFFAMAAFFVFSGFNKNGYSIDLAMSKGIYSLLNVLLSYVAGSVIGPLLLPWLPGRSFSIKGFYAGLGMFIISFLCGFAGGNTLETAAWALLITGSASFMTMNFTGASTYTSLSGVLKEMQVALPLQIGAFIVGLGLWITARFI